MTQDSDDILAQVFATLPTTETTQQKVIESTTTYEINSNVVKETHVVETIHTVESQHEIFESVRRASNAFQDFVERSGVMDVEHHEHEHHEHIHHESHEDHYVDHHHEEHHEDHHHENHHDELPELHYTQDLASRPIHEHIELGHGAVVANYQDHPEDHMSAVSAPRSVISVATSVSVHSSVSQIDRKHTDVDNISEHSEKSDDTIIEDHHHHHAHHAEPEQHSHAIHVVEHHSVHEHTEASVPSTPVVPQKSAPHDALIEEFKLLHHRVPSEVSIPPAHPPPPVPVDAQSDISEDSTFIVTMKVTEYEFDSDHVRKELNIEHKHEDHHELHEQQELVNHHGHDHHHHEEHEQHELQNHHGHKEIHVVESHHHAEEPVLIKHTNHHEESDNDDFHFETVEYHEEHRHVADHKSVASSVASRRSEPSAVFFQSAIHNKIAPQSAIPPAAPSSDSESDTLVGVNPHSGVHPSELKPNPSGPRVRDDPRMFEEKQKPVVAHVTPVVYSKPVQHQAPSKPASVVQASSPAHHEEVHHHEHHHHEEHHHTVDEDEIFTGPSVKNLRSLFENGGSGVVVYNKHTIHHHGTTSGVEHEHPHHEEHVHHHHVQPEVHHHEEQHVVEHHHHDHHEHKHEHHHEQNGHYHHEHNGHHHHKENGVPRLPLRESRVGGIVAVEHTHEHDHHHHHHHDHHKTHKHHEEVHVEKVVEVPHHEHDHHHEEHHHHHEEHQHNGHHNHHEHEIEHVVHVEKAVEEEQLPVSELMSLFGGAARLRRPDHMEEIRRKPSVQSIQSEVAHSVVSESSVTASSVSSVSIASKRSVQPVSNISIVSPPPSDHQSLRVVKSVRAFVSEWGQKDFKPPSSPVITVPRQQLSPKSPARSPVPEPASRKSTVISEHESHGAKSHVSEQRSRQSTMTSVASSEATLRDYVVVEPKSHNGKRVCTVCHSSIPASRRSSVQSNKSTVSAVSNFSQLKTIQEDIQHAPIHEDEEEQFILVPLSERRAMFERSERTLSVNRKLPSDAKPMINVLVD